MVRFAETHRVFFFEEPIDAAVGESANIREFVHQPSGVRVLTPVLPAGDESARREGTRQLLDAFISAENITQPILWYYTPLMRSFSAHLDACCVVYDCMDELANFKGAPPELRDSEAALLEAANVVFTGGASLYESKRSRHHNVRLFPSSVDVDHFKKARSIAGERADMQPEMPRPRFGFAGVIDERMDLQLLAGVADARPHWSFVMVGPVVKIDPATLPVRANIFYLGSKKYEELPNLLATWDAGIMPFAINEATRFISPTKTPEYFAAGLPVVSTPIVDVLRRYGNLLGLRVASKVSEFALACEQALQLGTHGGKWLDDADRVLALDSWDSTANEMRTAIARCISPTPQAVRDLRAPHISQHSPMYDYLVVGAGFAGSVLAERLARENNRRVLVIDKRPHVGGSAYDEHDDAGILVQKYGPRAFHTNSRRLLAYLSRFTEWRPYEHRVLAAVGGKLVPIPINRSTINTLYGLNLATEFEASHFLQSKAMPMADISSSEDLLLATVGTDLYETFFRDYTSKKWGVPASQLDKSLAADVQTRTNTDDRYYTDKFQCMPLFGYTRMIENMLSHDLITVLTGVDHASVQPEGLARHTIYSGPIDEYFNHRFGALPYRSATFKHVTLDQPRFQPAAVVNYPAADVPYTRITEYTHFTGQRNPRTSLSYEYPTSTGDVYYPMPSPANAALHKRYVQLARTLDDVTFVGRLGLYRNY
ncbi:MAG: UDP-galactopyranose mutase, partial [Gemmatimonadota bacterium]|nr:UDP-galactopyranose mutase [Gemmatimonadota bacterium]